MLLPYTFKKHSILPGFGLSLGYTLLYLSLIVLIPLAAVFISAATLTWEQFVTTVTAPRVMASYRLTFGVSFVAAMINVVFGLLVAWVLVRYRLPGKRFIDALIDLPFALPTAVAGIALTAVYASNGWIGRWLEQTGHKSRIYAAWGNSRPDVYWPAVCGADGSAGFTGFEQGGGRGGGELGRKPLSNFQKGDFAGSCSVASDGICSGFCQGDWRVRFSGVHRRQYADEDRDYAVADYYQARTIRLCRRYRHRSCDAGSIVYAAFDNQYFTEVGCKI